jgi:high-affinity nickel permease
VLAYKTSRAALLIANSNARTSCMIDPVNLRLALVSAAVLGFRHGLDYDHIAAITDISSVQSKARDAMRYGLL